MHLSALRRPSAIPLFVALCLLLLGGISAASPIYDLANDYSITNNGAPNNNWGYGVYSSGLNPATYTPFTVPSPAVFGALDVWSFAGSDPNIEKNVTGTDSTACCTIDWPAGQVAFGPFLGPTVARFTVPATGLYDLSATYTTIQTVNTPPVGYVYLGATQLYSQQLADPGNAQFGTSSNFTSNNVPLTAGQTLDFVVWGGNGNNKTTEVQATITSVPEPAALGLLGLGGLGVLARRRRA